MRSTSSNQQSLYKVCGQRRHRFITVMLKWHILHLLLGKWTLVW